jgi:antitoxin component HigA of HigAB toxin-antitoxin module
MHGPIDTSDIDAVEALSFLLEQNGMSASDLGRLLGNRQLGAAILRRERQLSKANIIKLRDRFKVSADLFLR